MMQVYVTQQIGGLDELEVRLSNLPKEIEFCLVKEALLKGAEIIVAAARSKAPLGKTSYEYPAGRVKNRRKLGQLKKSIRPMGRGKREMGAIVLPIGFGAAGYYGRFLERGWTPTGPHRGFRKLHELTVRGARRVLQSRRVKIGGLRFMRDAAAQNMIPAVDAVAKSVERGLEAWGK